ERESKVAVFDKNITISNSFGGKELGVLGLESLSPALTSSIHFSTGRPLESLPTQPHRSLPSSFPADRSNSTSSQPLPPPLRPIVVAAVAAPADLPISFPFLASLTRHKPLHVRLAVTFPPLCSSKEYRQAGWRIVNRRKVVFSPGECTKELRKSLNKYLTALGVSEEGCSIPAIYVTSLAAVEILRAREGGQQIIDSVDVTCGLSLGEYTALAFAGAFSFEDGLKLVKLRGQAMQEAADAAKSAMVSVIGLDTEKVQKLCDAANEDVEEDQKVQIANFLCPGNYAVSGGVKGIEALEAKAKSFKARMTVRLAVAGAFHTRFMEPAVSRLEAALSATEIRRPRIPVISNVDAQPHSDPDTIKKILARQVTSPVQWETTLKTLFNKGLKKSYELGPGKVIAGIIKRIDKSAEVENVTVHLKSSYFAELKSLPCMAATIAQRNLRPEEALYSLKSTSIFLSSPPLPWLLPRLPPNSTPKQICAPFPHRRISTWRMSYSIVSPSITLKRVSINCSESLKGLNCTRIAGFGNGIQSVSLKNSRNARVRMNVSVGSQISVTDDLFVDYKPSCAFLFPGQGAQAVGMGAEAKNVPSAAALVNNANDILGFDLLDICNNGPKEMLDSTILSQVCSESRISSNK
ncbi:hypothetical protein V2J09_004454, partial [Rumex salicifolius]